MTVQSVDHATTHRDGITEKSPCGTYINGLDGSNPPVGNSEVDGPLLGGSLGSGETEI
jgi:hypothetical protein